MSITLRNIVFALISMIWISSQAQETSIYSSWSTAVPMGSTTDYVKTASGRGIQFDVTQQINERFTYGGNFGWQAFYEKGYQIYFNDNAMVTAWQRNYLNAFFMMASGRYYFATSVNKIKAYLSIEIGATAIENYEIFGLYNNRNLSWHFALTPALGIDIPASEHWGLNVYFKFHNSFKNESSVHYSWINTGIGLYLRIPHTQEN